jgi:hypothetical protein
VAVGDVTVGFAAVYAAATPAHGSPASACTVTVPADADGIAVLDAAVASGCIGSYHAQQFPGLGHFVDAIDGVTDGEDDVGLCEFWSYSENGVPALDHGVDGFRASDGSSIEFVLEPYSAAALGC